MGHTIKHERLTNHGKLPPLGSRQQLPGPAPQDVHRVTT